MALDDNETAVADSSSATGVQNTEVEESPLVVENFTDKERGDWLKNRIDFPKEEKPKAKEPKEIKTEDAESSTATTPEEAEVAEKATEPAPVEKTQEPKKITPAEARIKDLLAENKSLKARLQPVAEKPKEPAEVEAKPEPKAEDYETVDAYLKALTDHRVSEAIRLDREARVAEQQKAEVERSNQEISDKWNSLTEESRKKHKDFDAIALVDDLPVVEGSVLDRWLINSDLGAEMLYYYGTNRDELTKLNAMSAFDAARELTKLELKLGESPVTEKAKPAPTKVTQAPPPPTEIATKGVTDAAAAAIAAGDMGAYLRLWKAKNAK